MNRDSAALALTGLLLGLLALSAATMARLYPATRAAYDSVSTVEQQTHPRAAGREIWQDEAAVPAMAEPAPDGDAPTAEPFPVLLRAPDPIPGQRLFVCDGLGCPLEELVLEQDGSASLGPLPPGRYSIRRGQTELASFCLGDDAQLSETSGRVWTDGRQLYLERFTPGTARLCLTLRRTGYYTVELRDRDGRSWSRDLYVRDGTQPDAADAWLRTLDFEGLPPGLYTAVRHNQPLDQVEVHGGEISELELEILK